MSDDADDAAAPDAGDDASQGDAGPRGERVAKYLARAGIASRRDAEKLIAEGKVKVNGKLVASPATFVTAADRIAVAGKPVAAPERTRLFRYHKPDGLVTTHRDPEGRPTVFDKLPTGLPRVVSVGRLDITSEGLLLLTNDGALARRLELPANGWLRRYRVRVHGPVDERALANLARGVTIEGVAYGPIEAGLDSRQGANAWLTVSLTEGKNREVRRVMAHLGLQVTRLIRVAYGPFQLGVLPRSGVEEVHPRILRDQLGIGEKPVRRRGRDAAAEPPPEPEPPAPPPGRARTIPRARNAAPRRPARAARSRRPPSRP